MSSTQKFNVGDRVRVVGGDRCDKHGHVGEVTFVHTSPLVPYQVKFDDDDYGWFDTRDIEIVAVNVKVVEGVVVTHVDADLGLVDVIVGGYSMLRTIDTLAKDGDEVRITIEVLRKAGDR